MKTTYNYAAHKDEVWYSEEEYNEALNKYSKAVDTCERLLMKLEEKVKEDEEKNTKNSNVSNSTN